MHVHLPDGALIRTTPEHPFFEQSRGWVAAEELTVGDVIRTDGGWTTVEDLLDTGEYEKVYNLRVADYHTYFVGCDEWDFSVWRIISTYHCTKHHSRGWVQGNLHLAMGLRTL